MLLPATWHAGCALKCPVQYPVSSCISVTPAPRPCRDRCWSRAMSTLLLSLTTAQSKPLLRGALSWGREPAVLGELHKAPDEGWAADILEALRNKWEWRTSVSDPYCSWFWGRQQSLHSQAASSKSTGRQVQGQVPHPDWTGHLRVWWVNWSHPWDWCFIDHRPVFVDLRVCHPIPAEAKHQFRRVGLILSSPQVRAFWSDFFMHVAQHTGIIAHPVTELDWCQKITEKAKSPAEPVPHPIQNQELLEFLHAFCLYKSPNMTKINTLNTQHNIINKQCDKSQPVKEWTN